MAEVNTQAALADFEGSREPAQETGVEYWEVPYNNDTVRLPLNLEVPFKSDGGEQRVPLSTILNRARIAGHLENKQKEWKERMAQFEQEQSQFSNWKELNGKYGEIQKWSEENPDQWDALWNLYQNRDQYLNGQDPNGMLTTELGTLKQQLKELAEFKQQFEQERMSKEEEAQVQEVYGEIESFSKEFPHINLEEQDLDGISLKGQILKFGADHNYPTFRAAALDYKFSDGTPLLNKLLDTVKRDGRNEAVKGLKQDSKEGIVSRSRTPQGQFMNTDPRALSEEEARDKALNDLMASWK